MKEVKSPEYFIDCQRKVEFYKNLSEACLSPRSHKEHEAVLVSFSEEAKKHNDEVCNILEHDLKKVNSTNLKDSITLEGKKFIEKIKNNYVCYGYDTTYGLHKEPTFSGDIRYLDRTIEDNANELVHPDSNFFQYRRVMRMTADYINSTHIIPLSDKAINVLQRIKDEKVIINQKDPCIVIMFKKFEYMYNSDSKKDSNFYKISEFLGSETRDEFIIRLGAKLGIIPASAEKKEVAIMTEPLEVKEEPIEESMLVSERGLSSREEEMPIRDRSTPRMTEEVLEFDVEDAHRQEAIDCYKKISLLCAALKRKIGL